MNKPPLSITHPELSKQAVGWDPSAITSGSIKKVRWRCDLDHEWEADINSRASRSRGCPYCSNNKVLPGYNDLATAFPHLVAEVDGWDPTTVAPTSGKKMPWVCQSGHHWNATVANRSVANAGCPYCSGRSTLSGINDLATTHPELASEANGWDPTTLSSGSSKKMYWQCAQGHQWNATVNSRAVMGNKCGICSGKIIRPGMNDLATLNPDLAKQADGWDPTQIGPGAHKKRGWKCEFGHTWSSLVSDRSNGVGCPICSNRKLAVGINDLASTHPDLAKEALGWDPATVMAGTNQKRRWQCSEGHTWNAVVNGRAFRGVGCPTCARHGFDPSLEGWLYFLEHDLWGLHQIGITNVPQQRLKLHESRGWRILELRGPMLGNVAREWEQSILKAIRARGVQTGPRHIAGKFDGYTESWVKSELKSGHLGDLMELVFQEEK